MCGEKVKGRVRVRVSVRVRLIGGEKVKGTCT